MTGHGAGNGGQDDRDHWRTTRRSLNQRRDPLTAAAERLYPDVPRVGSTRLLCRPEWLPARPVELDQVQLRWTEPAPAPAISGASPASAHVRPKAADGQRYPTYSDAVTALDPPAIFENRPTYRLLAASLAGAAHLDLTRGRYFDSMGVAEALAHELAAALPDAGAHIDMAGLPFRTAVGDPCDLSRRPANVAISTLTLRRTATGDASFLLHWRDAAKVAHAGGLYQVIPVGIFQPLADTPESECDDLSLWRSMVREFSEELLGTPENYTSDSTSSRDLKNFYRHLTEARESGTLRVWCLGLGVDPLTLVADILTVAVFDADLFDATFTGLVTDNTEGRVVATEDKTGFPFTEQAISRFTSGAEPMQAAGTAALQLAWKHRALLLG